MDSAEQQVVDHLKQARNILVTVRNSPTVDLLSACIGLALGLDKMDKHVAAVFSGEVPSTIEFLKPEETFEQNPDSLRDFIIALDKSKADKLRYKVEDKVVRIFITPYKTSLSQNDLQFSQGDFNVDAVVALGAHEQQELDQAITTHGRILHDATVMSINNTPNGNLGSVNWQDTKASSISELVTQLIKDLNKNTLDEQISTALLTGIVAETDRFSNEKTTPRTMSLAGDLMAAGANQQLVATQLQEVINPVLPDKPSTDVSTVLRGNPQFTSPDPPKPDDGALEIDHQSYRETENQAEPPENPAMFPELRQDRDILPMPEMPHSTGMSEDPFISGFTKNTDEDAPLVDHSFLVDDPTSADNEPSKPGRTEPSEVNPFDIPPKEEQAPLLERNNEVDKPADQSPDTPTPNKPAIADKSFNPSPLPPLLTTASLSQTPPVMNPVPLPSSPPKITPESIEEIEESVHSPHLQMSSSPPKITPESIEEIEESVHSPHLQMSSGQNNVDTARQEVMEALQSGTPTIEPLTALNANPLGAELHMPPNQVDIDQDGNLKPRNTPSAPAVPAMDDTADDNTPLDMPLPQVASEPNTSDPVSQPNIAAPSVSPPPVPPPFMPPPTHPNQ